MLMMVALAWRAHCFLFLGFWLLILIAIAELIGIGIIAYWIFSLGGVGEDALESMFGSASSHIEGFLSDVFERPIAITEGIVCKTYQACCRDTELLDAIRPELGSGSLDVLVGSDSSVLNASSSSFNFTFGVPRANHNATCLAPMQHEGSTTELELSLRDPSRPTFARTPQERHGSSSSRRRPQPACSSRRPRRVTASLWRSAGKTSAGRVPTATYASSL